MRIIFFFLFSILFVSEIYAQDIIQFKSGETVDGKVIEVGLRNVLFKMKEDTTKVFSVGKEEVNLIKFSNGIIDTIKYNAPKIESEYVSKPAQSKSDLLSLYGKKRIAHNGNILSDDALYKLLKSYPETETRKQLLSEFNMRKKCKQNEVTARILWPVLGFGIPFVAAVYPAFSRNYNGTQSQYISGVLTGAVIGAVVRIGGNVLVKINYNKRAHANEKIVDLYNGHQ